MRVYFSRARYSLVVAGFPREIHQESGHRGCALSLFTRTSDFLLVTPCGTPRPGVSGDLTQEWYGVRRATASSTHGGAPHVLASRSNVTHVCSASAQQASSFLRKVEECHNKRSCPLLWIARVSSATSRGH